MMHLLAVDAVAPFSLIKVLFCLLLLLGWAKFAELVDKDALYFHQSRRLWNGIQIGCGVVGFGALLLLPIYIAGLIIALAAIGGGIGAYVFVRNQAVPEKDRWRLDLETIQGMLTQRRQAAAERKATMRIASARGAGANLKSVPTGDDTNYDAHVALEELIDTALRRRASRIDIAGNEQRFVSQLTIDGVDVRHEEFPAAKAIAMLDYLKAHCALDVADRRKKQSGECGVEFAEHGSHELRLSISGSTRGITATIFIDAVKQLSIPVDKLGLLDPQLEAVRALVKSNRGAVLVACPQRSGRTTTLYTLATQHDPYTMDIHTLELEIERELEGTTQHVVAVKETPKTLQSLLLRDPQVVVVSSVNDAQTARLITDAGAEGKRLYAGVRADDTFKALGMWLKAVGDRQAVAKGLAGVIASRLIRRLCTVCRHEYQPDADVLRKLNLPANRISSLFKSGGRVIVKNKQETCPACQGVGYAGLTAAFEVMVLDDEALTLIRNGELDALRSHLRKRKMLWLEEAALAKVVNGVTSISEVMRAMGHAKDK